MIVIRSAKFFMQDILNINSCFINQDPVRTLIRFRSGYHGQILQGSITNDLSEPNGKVDEPSTNAKKMGYVCTVALNFQ